MPDRLPLSHPAVQQALGRTRRSKYGAKRTEVDGITFASHKEGLRYAYLREMAREGLIRDLQVHPRFDLHVCGVSVGRYTGDFGYVDASNGEVVVEDVKSPVTRQLEAYRLRRRMVEAEHGIVIREV